MRFRPKISDLFGAILILEMLVLGIAPFGDPGVGWHLKTGELINQLKSLPQFDPFLSLSDQTKIWIHDQWLSDLLFWKFYQWGGFPLLQVLTIILCVTPFIIFLSPLLKEVTTSMLKETTVLLFVIVMAAIQWFFRPVILSFFLFTYLYVQAYRFRYEINSRPKLFYTIPLVFIFWANLHPAFILGIFTLAIFFLESPAGKRKAFFLVSLSSALLTLINPWGFKLHQNILALGKEKYFMKLNIEWLSVDFQLLTFFLFFFYILLFFCYLQQIKKIVVSRLDLFLLGIFFFLTMLHRRYLPFFGIISALPLLKIWETYTLPLSGLFAGIKKLDLKFHQKEKNSFNFLATVLVSVFCFSFVFVQQKVPFRKETAMLPQNLPIAAVNYLQQQEIKNPVLFNHPDLGGLITWKLWPKYHAFIDDRNQLLGVSAYETFFKISKLRSAWQETFDQKRFNLVILSATEPLSILLSKSPDWFQVPVDIGENSVLFVKKTNIPEAKE